MKYSFSISNSKAIASMALGLIFKYWGVSEGVWGKFVGCLND